MFAIRFALTSLMCLVGVAVLSAKEKPAAVGQAASLPAEKSAAEKLAAALRRMNVEFKAEETEIGSQYFKLSLSSYGWVHQIEVAPSKDGLILTAPLAKIAPKTDAGKLAQILEANGSIGPCSFTIRPEGAELKLCMRLLVAGTSDEALQGGLDLLCEKVRLTHSLWAE